LSGGTSVWGETVCCMILFTTSALAVYHFCTASLLAITASSVHAFALSTACPDTCALFAHISRVAATFSLDVQSSRFFTALSLASNASLMQGCSALSTSSAQPRSCNRVLLSGTSGRVNRGFCCSLRGLVCAPPPVDMLGVSHTATSCYTEHPQTYL